MRVMIPPAERDLIERTLKFANVQLVPSTTDIESIFRSAPLVQATTAVFKVLRPQEVDAYRMDQRVLRDVLAGIASGRVVDRRRWAEHATRTLGDTVHARLAVVGSRLVFAYQVTGVIAATWLAVAFLLDEGRGLTNRLGQCRKPGCGKFNLTFEGKRRVFCNDAHRLAYDRTVAKDRVRAWRRRQKKEK
jgi:hypothetical protein